MHKRVITLICILYWDYNKINNESIKDIEEKDGEDMRI